MNRSHGYYMNAALGRAKTAAMHGEIPVGAVIVHKGKIIAGGRNKREASKNALCHAEILAIDSACRKLGGWRLFECDMYVTLEPCPMCAGAIINSRIRNLYIGTEDPKAGSFGSVIDFNDLPYNHKPSLHFGICRDKCSDILKSFFKDLREQKKKGESQWVKKESQL